MNSILEQACELVIWIKDGLKQDRESKFAYSYKNNFIDKIKFNLCCSFPDTGRIIYNPNDWLMFLKEKGLKDIKIYSPIEEKEYSTMLMPESQRISIICFFYDSVIIYRPRWVYNSEKKHWRVTYNEMPNILNFLRFYADNTENFRDIVTKIYDYLTSKNDSYAAKFYDIIETLSDKTYNFDNITKNDSLYMAASMADDLFCGMGSWGDCCTSQEEHNFAKELYKQERLALLYCINEL